MPKHEWVLSAEIKITESQAEEIASGEPVTLVLKLENASSTSLQCGRCGDSWQQAEGRECVTLKRKRKAPTVAGLYQKNG